MLENLNPFLLAATGLVFLALVVFVLAILGQADKRNQALTRIEYLVEKRRQTQSLSVGGGELETQALSNTLDQLGAKLKNTSAYRYFVEGEDQVLLSKAALTSDADRNRFVAVRLILSALSLVVWFFLSQQYDDTATKFVQLVGLFGLAYMAPKWMLKSYSKHVEKQFNKELVALVDVMRLLQGVGLSVEQSLEVVAMQLRDLVPVTGRILYRAKEQVRSGVSWTEILQKMTQIYDTSEFRSFVSVISQIEKYGGAVQEPLRQFSERLIERERASIKETIGKLTVKITGIMVVTMMPALLIVAGGPGVISISQAF